MMNVLFLTYGLPYPPDSGARMRDFAFIRLVSRQHNVFVLSLCFSSEQLRYLPDLKPYCAWVDGVVQRPRTLGEHAGGIRRSLCAHRPLVSHTFFYEELARKLRQVLQSWPIDLVQVEHSFLAFYADVLEERGPCKKILDFHNVAWRQYRRMARLSTGSILERLTSALKCLMLLNWEAEYAQRFDRCLVTSQAEARLLTSRNAALPLSIIENGVDTTMCRPIETEPDDDTLIFVGGMYYPPNQDGILYFCRDILPLIRRRRPHVRLLVVGGGPPPELMRIADRTGIKVTGHVEDVVPYYRQARLSIVPLRAGGGTRLKMLEAMALGRPVVSTSIGCEGLEVVDGEHIMVADTPEEFADRVVALLTDPVLAATISQQAYRKVREQYCWSAIGQRLLAVYDDVLRG